MRGRSYATLRRFFQEAAAQVISARRVGPVRRHERARQGRPTRRGRAALRAALHGHPGGAGTPRQLDQHLGRELHAGQHDPCASGGNGRGRSVRGMSGF
ncbi:MAG: hypothetical protein MZV63_22180 [Marinilabiliales bacterium]|nr:hypothetical protein [Marinilabiliales bacterium]